MPRRPTPIGRIDLTKKFHNRDWVVIITQGQMAFVFRDSVHIHDAHNDKAHGTGYPPIRPFFRHRFYDMLEAFPVQDHHGAFMAESPAIFRR